MATSNTIGINDIIALDRYPIHRPDSAEMLGLKREASEMFRRTGLCILPDFLRPGIAETMTQELLGQRDIMFASRAIHNIYQEDDDDPDRDGAHPRNRKMLSECLCLPYDDIPFDAAIRQLYRSDAATRFVSAIVSNRGTTGSDDVPPLHRFADPLGALTINVLLQGHQIDWHFDQAQFVVILLLQNAQHGGRYEVAPESRCSPSGDSNFALHRRILDETEPGVISHRFEPGTLILHTGTHSLHRVTRVEGARPRVSALLAYANQPEMLLTPTVRQTYYGRRQARNRS